MVQTAKKQQVCELPAFLNDEQSMEGIHGYLKSIGLIGKTKRLPGNIIELYAQLGFTFLGEGFYMDQYSMDMDKFRYWNIQEGQWTWKGISVFRVSISRAGFSGSEREYFAQFNLPAEVV